MLVRAYFLLRCPPALHAGERAFSSARACKARACDGASARRFAVWLLTARSRPPNPNRLLRPQAAQEARACFLHPVKGEKTEDPKPHDAPQGRFLPILPRVYAVGARVGAFAVESLPKGTLPRCPRRSTPPVLPRGHLSETCFCCALGQAWCRVVSGSVHSAGVG